jgi:EmrB/QacA subfamily drug resistance transporter
MKADVRPPPPALSIAEIRLIVIGVLVAMFLAALDQTIVATAMPTIGRDLGDADLLPWVVSAYLLTATAVTPLYGKFADSHGRRQTLLVGIVVFMAGSVACALAPTMPLLIVARGLQGLGGGGLIALAQTIIADVVAPKERARYQIYIAGVYASSSLLGPVLGGLFAQHLHWSAIFWINLPIGLVAIGMTWHLLRKLPRFDRPHLLDVAGAVLIVAATVTLMLVLSWGGVQYPWTSAPILSLSAASILLWILFGLRLGTAPEPLIPLSVLRNQVVRTGMLAASMAMGVFVGLTIYIPIYMEEVRGYSASDSGLALIPLMVGTVTGATISGRLMLHVTHYKRLPIVGLVVAVAGTLVLAAFSDRLPLWLLEVLLAAISMGLGTILPVTTVAIQNAVPVHQLGTATAALNFFRQLGGAVLVAAFGAILVAAAAREGGPQAFADLLHAGPSLAPAFRWIFLAAAVGLLVSLAWLIRMKELPLRSRVDAPPVVAD